MDLTWRWQNEAWSNASFDLLLHVAKHHDDTSVETEGFGDNDEGKFKKDQDDNTDKEKAKSVDKAILWNGIDLTGGKILWCVASCLGS